MHKTFCVDSKVYKVVDATIRSTKKWRGHSLHFTCEARLENGTPTIEQECSTPKACAKLTMVENAIQASPT